MKSERKNSIAVYGTLRRGCGNHRYLLSEADFLGEFDSEPTFSLYSLGGFPGLKNNGNTSVKMEVFAVNDDEAEAVDQLEGYQAGRKPHFYDKQDIETPFGTAGVYIYVRDTEGRGFIETGDWLNQEVKVVRDGMVE